MAVEWERGTRSLREHLEGGWGATPKWGKDMLKLSPCPMINERRPYGCTHSRWGRVLRWPDCWYHPQFSLRWGLKNGKALWKFAKAKKCVLGDVCKLLAEGISEECSAHLQRLHPGSVYPLWGERVTGAGDGSIKQRQTRLVSCPDPSPQTFTVTAWPAYHPLADRGPGAARTYRVVQRLRWQTADAGGIQGQRVCRLPPSFSSFCFELNLCILLQNSSLLNLDLDLKRTLDCT